MDSETFVIVGASMAGSYAAAELRKEGFGGKVFLVGNEDSLPYERPDLSKGYLRGTVDRGKLDVHPAAFYVENSIEVLRSTRVSSIDLGDRTVAAGSGRIHFDRLLIATGSEPRKLSVPGADLEGVHVLRTISDADAIRTAASKAQHVVIVGGGWIGSEVAASLRQLGTEVSMIMPQSTPLERVLGPEVGAVYRDLHIEHGVKLLPGRQVVALRGGPSVEAVETDDGARINCDLVIAGIGASPRIELAKAAGIEAADGIFVNERLETNVPGVFAAGDVAAAWHPLFETRIRVEHWDNARKQGSAAAAAMLGRGEPYARIPFFYSDQYDFGMEYVGYAREWDRVVFRGDPASRKFLVFWLRGGQVVAGMNANIWHIKEAIAALVASKKPVSVARLVDPSIPIDQVAAEEAGATHP